MPTAFRRSDFGPDFKLGVATSSYQIEGAVAEDGRKPSIWDTFSHAAGKTKGGHTGDIACDHYHRMPEDVALLGWLGVDAYRFSIAWPRVLPEGRGAVNEVGLDFYDQLVDALLEQGISPAATLYHWDLPAALPGGWLSRGTVDAFAEYARVVSRRLGDRVGLWLTHNEPWCQAFLGYELGLFAPGHRSLAEALACAHHLLVSHGLAVQALRAEAKAPVGIALNFMPAHPATDSAEDRAAARRLDGYFNRWFAEPVAGRGYPLDMVELYGARMPKILAGDDELMRAPIDVMGINYYERAVVAHHERGGFLQERRIRDTGLPRTADREIYPAGLAEVARWLHRDLGFGRLVVTENGAAYPDTVDANGEVHDAERVAFLQQHLDVIRAARVEGLPIEACFVWSLLDNFEWSEGYSLRYGICHVDFETQRRVPKDSARFLRSLSQR